ncbi:MAG: 30S ribosomal protein S21 [Candidatus Niyogibacteria bacterium]|nr:30S ribosomal protein S21 [Candidatus Niyogibacteria bacterium]
MSSKNVTIIEVRRRQNETPVSLVRRFSRKVQQAGVVKHTRKGQFHLRPVSRVKKKNSAMRRIARRKEFEHLRKIGKLKKKK